MGMTVDKIFRELEISDIDTDSRSITVLTEEERIYEKKKRYLNLYASLMAASEGRFSPGLGEKEPVVHRFDWQFGISMPTAPEADFDWIGALRDDRSISIQIIIEPPADPGLECVVAHSDINGFTPLNVMKDDATNYLSLTGSIIGGFSPLPSLTKMMDSLTGELERKEAATYENRFKNMFRLFRFLTDGGLHGIEYVLTKDILDQWGPFLRGSFGLCFLGSPDSRKTSEYRIRMYPKLGFKKNDHLCFLPSPEEQEEVHTEISVRVQ